MHKPDDHVRDLHASVVDRFTLAGDASVQHSRDGVAPGFARAQCVLLYSINVVLNNNLPARRAATALISR
jgi:hypothetical protein